jgi:stress-induced-phosphoprotein 1
MAEELKTKGNAALQANRFDEAIDYYSQAIKIDSNNHVLFSNRSAALVKAKKYTEALEDAEQCIKINPNWSKGYSRKGNAFEFLGRLSDAKTAYEAGLKIDPTNDQLKQSLNNISQSSSSDGDQPGSFGMNDLFNDPNFMTKLQNHPKCREHLKDPDFLLKLELIRKNPKLMGSLLNDKRMMDVLGALIGLDSSQFEVHTPGDGDDNDFPTNRQTSPPPASSSQSTKKPTTTTTKEEKMEVDNLTNEQKLAIEAKEKGNESYKKKDFPTALTYYDEALKYDPTNITYYNNKAAAYFEMKEYDQCIEQCDKAVEIGRENRADYKLIARSYSRMATAYHKLDDLQNAKKFYDKSLSEFRAPDVVKKSLEVTKLLKERERLSYLNPELAEEEKAKGNEAFQKGRYPEAMKHYTQAIKRNPQDPRIYSNRAACYTKLLEFPSALKDCEDCIKLDPKFIKGYLRKGAVLFAMKEFNKSADAYRQALKLDPNCSEAQDGYRQSVMDGDDDPQSTKERVLNDPEIQEILADPAMQMILSQMQKEPAALREHLQNPHIAAKLQKLMSAGVIALR